MRMHREIALALLAGLGVASRAHAQAATPGDSTRPADARESLEEVLVEGRRIVTAGPMPGLELTRDQLPSNVQSIDAADIRESRALGIGDLMNSRFQGVSVNDYQGNPFQVDVNFRGFTASPQLGTAQGLSVFMDGVRVNEPFGDVVNWDLLPLNAVNQMDLFPGSNPLFGLNTLGGAISLRTKSGFDADGFEVEGSAGSWDRVQAGAAGGLHGDKFAAFGAISYFNEDGWRDNSPSTVRQGFFRGDWRDGGRSLTATALLADNNLIGNGLIPIELYKEQASSVYTSPDQTKNRLSQFQLSGLLPTSEHSNLTAMAYRRDSRRRTLNGDVFDGFEDLESSHAAPIPPTRSNPSLPVCQYADPDGTGVNFDLVEGPPVEGVPPYFIEVVRPPLNAPCTAVTIRGSQPRNGAHGPFDGYGGNFDKYPGVIEGTPIGILSRAEVQQVTTGGGLQFNWNLPRHKFMMGSEYHGNRARYDATQQLGLIDATHNVYAEPDAIDGRYRAAQGPITINAFSGTSHTLGLYLTETWTARPNLFVTAAARYNRTHVANDLKSRLGDDLSDISNLYRGYILCPSADPASCPDPAVENVAGYRPNDLGKETLDPTKESYTYKSFDPSVGVNYLPLPGLNVFFNASRGTRVPSIIELGCAYDATPVQLFPGFTDEGSGVYYPPSHAPRSIVGPTCSLPTTLSGDPYLPQIRATSFELGVRGQFGAAGRWQWNASAFRTDLMDDIYFVGVSAERSFFQTVGKSRREGFEAGIKGSVGRVELRLNYAMTDATFRSTFYVLSPGNSSADFDQNSNPLAIINAGGVTYPPIPTATTYANGGNGTFLNIRVDPGAHMPGIPLHNLNANLVLHVTPALRAGLTLIAHSKSYVRGNENNRHLPEGSDQQTGFYYDPCQGGGAVCPLQQFGTPRGRPFDDKGTVPGAATVNLDLSYEMGPGFRLVGQVTNLFDKGYQTAGRLGVNPFSPSVYGTVGESGFNYNSTDWQNTTFVGPASPRGVFLGFSAEVGR